MTTIPYIRVSGDARSRGLMQGDQLKARIQKTVAFYKDAVFKPGPLSLQDIQLLADKIKAIIKQFDSDYCDEIEAIAEACELPAWELYALNARTEIVNSPVAECTSMVFKEQRVLGQTWDWHQVLEDLIVLVEHEYPDGRKILTLTEPGMLAKIGINNHGLGLCINILSAPHPLDSLPVHILTRALLESRSVEQARQVLSKSGEGRSSHFLLLDKSGDCLSMEFSGGKSAEVPLPGNAYIHSNHCLAKELDSKLPPSTIERLAQGKNGIEIAKQQNLNEMKKILLDDSAGALSIQCPYHPVANPNGDDPIAGTCATVLMDVEKRVLQIKKGPERNEEFIEYDL